MIASLCLLLALLPLSVLCAHWEGTLTSKEQFVFLDRFAFAETVENQTVGEWSYTFNAAAKHGVPAQDVQVDLYYDSKHSWFEVYGNNSLSCEEKRAKAATSSHTKKGTDTHIHYGSPATVQPISDTKAPHFWYFAVSNCAIKPGTKWAVDYSMSAKNPGDSQFGVDQAGLLGMHATFGVFYLLALAVAVHGGMLLKRRGQLSLVVRASCAVLALLVSCEWLDTIHYVSFASNGHGIPFFHTLADLLDTVAQLVLLLLILALSQGYGVCSATVRDPRALRVVAVVAGMAYALLFFWRVVGESRESTLYYYESAPGVISLLIRALLCAYFLLSVRMTWREESNPKTRNFFLLFTGLYLLWFIVLVFIVLIAAATPPVYRMRTVETMYTLQNFTASTVLALLFHPSVSERFFELGGGSTEALVAKALHNPAYTSL